MIKVVLLDVNTVSHISIASYFDVLFYHNFQEKDIDNALDDMISAVKEHSLTTLQNLLEHCGKT